MEGTLRGIHYKDNEYELAKPSSNFDISEYETTDDMIYTETTSGQYDCLGGNDLRRNNTNNEHLYDHTVNVSNSKDNINIYDKTGNMKSDTDPEDTYNHTNFRKCWNAFMKVLKLASIHQYIEITEYYYESNKLFYMSLKIFSQLFFIIETCFTIVTGTFAWNLN